MGTDQQALSLTHSFSLEWANPQSHGHKSPCCITNPLTFTGMDKWVFVFCNWKLFWAGLWGDAEHILFCSYGAYSECTIRWRLRRCSDMTVLWRITWRSYCILWMNFKHENSFIWSSSFNAAISAFNWLHKFTGLPQQNNAYRNCPLFTHTHRGLMKNSLANNTRNESLVPCTQLPASRHLTRNTTIMRVGYWFCIINSKGTTRTHRI